MNFIRSIVNQEDMVLDKEVEQLLEKLAQLEEPRYTASEWAAMEGGHNIEELSMIDEAAWDRIAARVEVRDMTMWRLIVGAKNIMKAKNFLELAKQGKTVPGTFVTGFLPALQMLDDIVTAGPGYIQMLKVIHNKAKRSK